LAQAVPEKSSCQNPSCLFYHFRDGLASKAIGHQAKVRPAFTRGQAILRAAWHDPSGITPEVLAGYPKPLQVENWDQALWKLTLVSHALGLEAKLDIIQMPTLVVTGDGARSDGAL
jgi:hypothetical protein